MPQTIESPAQRVPVRLTRAPRKAASAAGEALLLPGLLALGLALRLWGLARFPFEQDELYTIIESRYLFRSPLNPGIQARPLYYLLQHPLLQIAPVNEAWLRLLPLIFGLAGIWATWALGKRLFGVTGAAAAAFLAVVSPWQLYASGMARYWSLVYLLTALACLFLLRAYASDRRFDLLAALATLALGMATHPSFAFPMIGVVAGLSLVRPDGRIGLRWPSRRAWIWLWLPLLALLGAGALSLELSHHGDAVRNWGSRGLLATLRLVPAMVQWMTPAVFASGALGAFALAFLRAEPARRAWGLITLFGGGTAAAALLAASTRTSVYADYGIGMLPLIFVSAGGLIALGRERLPQGGRALAWIASLVLLAGVAPSLASNLSDGMRFDYRPAFRDIAAADPALPVLSVPIVLQRFYAPALRGQELRMDTTSLATALSRSGPFWVVTPVRRQGIWMDASGQVASWVSEHCRLFSSHQRTRLDYRLYRTDLYRCGPTEP